MLEYKKNRHRSFEQYQANSFKLTKENTNLSRSIRTLFTRFVLLAILLSQIKNVNGQVYFKSISADATPKTIGASSTLTFVALLPTGTYYQSGDQLTFNVPSPGAFTSSTSISNCVSQTSGLSVTSCIITTNTVTLIITNTTAQSILSFVVKVSNFINPPSTSTISGFTVTLTNGGTTRATTQTSGSIQNFSPDSLNAASIASNSTLIGDSSASLIVNLTPKNKLSAAGKIYVDLPIWNPQSQNEIHMIQTTSPTCTGVKNMLSSITCSYDQVRRRLTLTNMISSDITGGTTALSFNVGSFLNPYSGIPKTAFYVSTADSQGNQVDQSTNLNITVTSWASFLQATFDRADGQTTVNELSTGIVLFYLNLPVEANCMLRIDFPSDQPLTNDLTSYVGANLFSTVTQNSFNLAGNYITLNGCSSASDAISQGYIELHQVLNANQVKTTNSFSYSLYAISNSQTYPIAQQTTQIVVSSSNLETGAITSLTVTAADSKYIQSTTRFQLTILPEHSVPTNSKLVVTFPTSITLTDQSSCTLSSVSGGISTSPGSCTVSSNVLTITNPFGTGSYTKNGSALSFIFSVGGANPQSSQDAGTFQVTTQSFVDAAYYTIDSGNFSGLYTPIPFILNANISLISSYQTYYSPSTYTIDITPNKVITLGGYVNIIFPTQISLLGSTLSSCQLVTGSTTKSLTQCTITATSPITIAISDAFATQAYTSTGTDFKIVLGGLVNPRTTATTSSFTVSTTDSSKYAIESLSTGITVTMKTTPNITSFTVTPTSSTTGDTTSYLISVVAALPIQSTDSITFIFPPELSLPSTLSCTGSSQISAVACSLTGTNTIKATLTATGGTIAASSTFSFYVQNVKNPASTKPTSTFSGIIMKDQTGVQITQFYGSAIVTMTTPATVLTATLSQNSLALATYTQYTITYTTINAMASGASFLINYPSTVSMQSISTCSITFQSTNYAMSCSLVQSSKQVQVSSGLTVAIPASSSISILFGDVENPNSQKATSTLTLTSYTDSSYAYSYDTIQNGLVPQFDCNYPCQTCPPNSKSSCLSCITNVTGEIYKYLNGTSCLASCPDGWYSDSNLKCQKCPAQCLTCSDSNTCITCDTTSIYPYLLQNWCYSSCPNGMCSVKWQCQFCSLSAFQIVNIVPTTKTVSATSNTLTITAMLPSGSTYTDGSLITYSIPSPGSFTPSTASSLCNSGTNGITVKKCIISANSVTIQIAATSSTLTSLSMQIGNFNNPSSTCTLTGIGVTLVNGNGNSVAQTTTATMSGLIAATMSQARVASSSTVVGTSGNQLTVSFTVATYFTSSSYIQVTVPYWNPSSTQPQHSIQSPSPTCVGTSPLKTSLTCYYSYDSSRTLTASSVIDSSSISSGTSVSFTSSNFVNPYSTIPKSGFVITTYDSNGCSIDQSGSLSLTISDWGNISQPTIARQDTVTEVNQYSVLAATFNLQYPVDSGCRLRIYLPSDMPVDSNLATVSGTGLFSALASLTTLNVANNYLEVDGCPTYQDGGQSALVSLSSILNKLWVQQTQSFQYELYAMSSSIYYKIARATSGIVLPITAFTPGQILSFSIQGVTSMVVQDLTTFKLTFQPKNSIPTSSLIQIIFPPSITLTQQSACTLSSVSGGISATGFSSCTVTGSVLTITNPFGTGSYTKNGSALSFIFSVGGTNPSTVQDAGTFEVSTFELSGTSTFAIDDSQFSGIYTPSPSLLQAQVLTISSTVTSDSPTTYTLQITPNKTIPAGGLISITFPTEISFPSGMSSFTGCQVNINGLKTVTCSVSKTSPITLTISNAFSTDYTSNLTPFTVIMTGLQNPRTLLTTSSFSITTSSSDNKPIQSVTSGVTTTMASNPELTTFQVTPSNFINGNINDYLVTVKATLQLKTTDIIKFTFPVEFSISSPSCTASTQLSAITCTSSGNSMTATLTFSSSPLSANTNFAFYVKQITNPPSTKPTSVFTNIQGFDSSSNQIFKYSNGPTITTTTPATIQTKSLLQANTNLAVGTTYTILFTSINLLPSGSTFVLTYPSAVTPTIPFSTCQIKAGTNTFTMSSCTINTSTRQITLSNGFSANVAGGSSIQIIMGPITNPSDYSNTDSFTMTSYTDNTLKYSIDQIADSLIPSFACTLPCKTCSSSSKTSCTSCFTSSSLPYYYTNNCILTCPAGTYADSNKICQTCPSTCKTCTNSTSCLTCDTTSKVPLLYNGQCVAGCPDGYYSSSGQCLACNTTLCKTCNYTSSACTSCNANKPFLTAANQCQTSCDTGYVSINYKCTKCTSPCATCLVATTTCSSCLSGLLFGTTCIAACPSGYTLVNGRCIGCDPNCQQCSITNSSQCLLCNSGYYLINSTCYTSCPDGYKPDSTNTSCQEVITSPVIIPTTTNASASNNSILAYFPFLTTSSVLGLVSVGGWIKDRSSIIPSNCVAMWGPVHFLSLGTQTSLSYLYITGKYNSTATTSTVATTSTALQVFGENNGRFLGGSDALTSSEDNVLPIVFYGTIFALFIFILVNVAFFIAFIVVISKDQGYQDHRKEHCCLPVFIITIGTMFGFQLANFYYSRFFGLRSFYVHLQDKARLHSMLNVLTVIHILLTLLPTIFIDIYALLKYPWGSQFYVECIETLVLSLFQLIFKIWDFKAQKQAMKPLEAEQMVYASVPDQSMEDPEEKRLNEERKRYNGMTMEEYLNHLLGQKEIEKAAYDTRRPIKKSNSMIDLGDRSKEEDDRRVNTDPLDEKQKKRYERWENTFEIDKYPDNCFAEPGEGEKQTLDPSRIKTKVIQYGEIAEDGEDYDKEYERKIRELFHGRNPADERNDLRYMTQLGNDDLDQDLAFSRKKNRLRGRKGKYYEQVDDEDQTFLQDQERMNELDEYGDEDGPDGVNNLDMIEEESHQEHEVEDDKVARNLEEQILDDNIFAPLVDDDLQKNGTQRDIEEDINQQTHDNLLSNDLEETQLFDIEEAKGDMGMLEQDPQEEIANQSPPKQNNFMNNKDTLDQLMENQPSQEQKDDVIDDPLLLTQRDDQVAASPPDEKPKEEDYHQQEEEIIKHEEELGEPDKKRRFNVNDVLGEFDRDEKGNLVILQENKSGNLIDKDGNRVNEKGYLIDEKTGDVVEKERRKKVFDAKELDERGELPPPYNLERFNFNIHDVRGYFDRDDHGDEIIGKRRDTNGNLIDKQGRRVNEHGYLVDAKGNLVDKRGRVKLHKQIMDQNNGDIPLLFNYKGKKFDVTDIMGDLDKDRNGNIIIRRVKDNNLVDKKGRRVNRKGYLIDESGNVINKDGKIMFESMALSKDDEIPKLFPFLKFNIDDIKGDYEMDPLGNPMLHTTRDGELVDAKGRKVNEKGYLLDENGNIRNKRGYKVFNKYLMEDGDIPKVFRTGLLRKDTYDSFSQLMSEIEDLERMQEMDIDDPRRQVMKNKMSKENERLQKRIDKIVEEDLDDDDMLMKEVEKLAQGGTNSDADAGNTSVESAMEDTPSNYNIMNQRFNEIEDIKNQARINQRNQRAVPEEFEYESEYSYLPGKKLKKKKKKKKKVKKEPEIDLRELKMAVAYGGLSQAQYDKIVATKKIRDAQNSTAQMAVTTSQFGPKPPIQRNASNTRMTTVHSRRGAPGGFNQQRQGTGFGDDLQSEFGGAESINLNQNIRPALGQLRIGTSTKRTGEQMMNKTTSRLTNTEQNGIPPSNMKLRKNNLMSDKGDNKSELSDKLQSQNLAGGYNDRERRLSQIANSVSGFYINKEASEQSLMRSTHESNFAQNLGKINRRVGQHPSSNPLEESKIANFKPPNTAGFGGLGGNTGDPELDRIYGTARGLADLTQLSDWEKDSQKSGKSARSQFPQMNALKVRGLENIYLQRLEPASKGRQTALKGQSKAKFRVMHHKYHDNPEWHVDDQRDELDSVLSDNYKQMEMKFMQEFQGNSSGGKPPKKSKNLKDKNGINIFSGKLNQYKEKQQTNKKNTIDFNKY